MEILCSLLVGLHRVWNLEPLLVGAEVELAVVHLKECHENDRRKTQRLMMMWT
jgi:hypothetical protein